MSKLTEALRHKFGDPRKVLLALGLDENLIKKEIEMAKTVVKVAPLTRTGLRLQTALYTHLLPKLAQDAKLDLMPALKGVDAKNYKEKLPSIVKMAKDAADPLMTPEAKAAGGAGPDDVIIKLLDMVGGQAAAPEAEAVELDAAPTAAVEGAAAPAAAAAAPGASDPNAALMGFLKDCGLDEAAMAKVAELLGSGGALAPKEKTPGAEDDDEDDVKVTPQAMDAAIKKAQEDAKTSQRATFEAHEFVRPWVGNLSFGAFDSAEGVHRHALKMLGVKVDDSTPAAALTHIIQAQAKPGRPAQQGAPAMDSAQAGDFAERFPAIANIQVL